VVERSEAGDIDALAGELRLGASQLDVLVGRVSRAESYLAPAGAVDARAALEEEGSRIARDLTASFERAAVAEGELE
jgi:hypothetical protein